MTFTRFADYIYTAGWLCLLFVLPGFLERVAEILRHTQ